MSVSGRGGVGDGLYDRVKNKHRVQMNDEKNAVSCEESKDVQNVSYVQGDSVCVSGSEEPVSKLADLCQGEGGGSKRGDVVCQEEVECGEGGWWLFGVAVGGELWI